MNYEQLVELVANNAKAIAELRASNAEASARLDRELAAEQVRRDEENAKRDKEFAATMARWDSILQRYGGHMDNDGRKVEEFFIEGLRKKELVVGALEFDELLANITRIRKKVVAIELDALLLNGTMVGILEIKSTLHRNDVLKVHDSLVPRFREFYTEYHDKELVVMVAGELVNPDAAKLAREFGFILLSPDNQELRVDDSCYRAA